MISVCEVKSKTTSLTQRWTVLCVRETPHTPQSVPLTAATLSVREAPLSHSGSYLPRWQPRGRGNANQYYLALFCLSCFLISVACDIGYGRTGPRNRTGESSGPFGNPVGDAGAHGRWWREQ
jgi:hypothetical protein